MKILSIETSCDETAAAVIEKDGRDVKILSNIVASQIKLHQKYGGVFPEIASRAHVEKIIPVVETALNKASSEAKSGSQAPQKAVLGASVERTSFGNERATDIDIIAVTTGPGLIGSLLIGVNFAKALAFAKNKPIIPINHLLGHVYSNFSSSPKPHFSSLIILVSGGHTGLYLMKSHNDIKPLGQTLDDAAGEAFDKVAKLLGLGYPGGPAIAQAAQEVKSKFQNPNSKQIANIEIPNIKLPRSMLDSKDYNFSFSGLKTAVLYKVRELEKSYRLSVIRNQLAAEFQQAVIDILIGKTIQAAYEFKPKSICLCGGVSANKELRSQLKKAVSKLPWKTTFHVPDISLSTDNAAMIGIAAAYHLDKKTTYVKINANSNLKL